MFAFEVEYLLSRSFAASFLDRDASEWPPHPARLFSALAASYFENGAPERERLALEWLEKQPAPLLHAGEASEANVPDAFVPANYVKKGDYLPILRNKQPRTFPAQSPSDAVVHFIWPKSQPDSDIATCLDDLASRTAYLGRSCSVVRMRVTLEAPPPNYEPGIDGNEFLRVPAPGRLAELKHLFLANQRPTPGLQLRYRSIGATPETPLVSNFDRMEIFRKISGPNLPIEAALTVTTAVRAALMHNAEHNGYLTALLHGHDDSPHCSIAALPFVEHKHADGHLMGFAVIFPRNTKPADRRAVVAACMDLCEKGLNIPSVGDWKIESAETTALTQTLRASTWTNPSTTWQSVTPVLLDRFPKKNGRTVEDILILSCERIGLPAPRVCHGPYSSLKGVSPVPSFRLRRKPEERPRWGVHATLTFPSSVRGPILLGAGRFFGLGLMKPVAPQEPAASVEKDIE